MNSTFSIIADGADTTTLLNDRLLRPALVGVSAGGPKPAETPDGDGPASGQ